MINMVATTCIYTDLAKRREALGMPINELSRRAGVSVSTVNRFLSGRNSPRVDHALRISECLGVPGLCIERAVDIDHMRRRQALAKARKLVGLVQGTSALEGQAVDKSQLRHMVQITINKLLSGPRSELWASM